ncbi:MAG: ribosome maturation factor RimM [Bacteroidales bacterium]|jgi:16S rRNA processing protein RimM
MIDLSDCILLGTITKLHGVHGRVIIRLNNIGFDNIREMESVFIEIDGLPVPFFISEYSEKAPGYLIVDFEDIDNVNKARELTDAKVFIPVKNMNSLPRQSSDLNQLIGYQVIDKKLGTLGMLDEIIDIQQNPLFSVLHDKKEILVPTGDEFILNIDHENRTILVETPKGLIEL